MRMRGAWRNAAKFICLATLTGGVLLLTSFGGAGKRSNESKANMSAPTNKMEKPESAKENSRWAQAYGKLTLSFEENQGQTAREVRFVSHGSGYELFLTPQEVVVALRPRTHLDFSPLHRTAYIRAQRRERQAARMTAIRMRLEGANPVPQITGMEQLPGRANYFIGNDPKNWHTDVPSYARVRYAQVYPGVDLVFYGNQGRLEYDFVVAPGADPGAIQLKIDGAQKMRVNSSGDLVLGVGGGEVVLEKPFVYQQTMREQREVAGKYVLMARNRVTFAVAAYDRRQPLILDPVLNYSTYLGGGAGDVGLAIAVDASGNAFIGGQTLSTNFPAGTNPNGIASHSPNNGTSFVAEIDPTGTKLLYSGYLAGTNTGANEQANGVAVDSAGKVYITGLTVATDFPTSSTNPAFKAGFKVSPNASNVNGTSYIVKLDPTVKGTGSILYSSYIGGTDGAAASLVGDLGHAIAVDSNGIAYVVGYTDSTPSATVTSQLNFPVVNGFQATLNTAQGNAFLAKIDTTQSGTASLLYSTYLGGSGANALVVNGLGFGEDASGVAIDSASGIAYISGTTTSTDFPTNGTVTALQASAPAGNTMATGFVTKIDTTKPANAQLVYSTYLGGAAFDEALAIALGPNKVAYVTGTTNSTNFPNPAGPTPGAFDASGPSIGKAFITLLDTTSAAGASLKYSTYLGGTNGNTGFGIQVDASGNAYVGGTTGSANFPFPLKSAIVGGFEPTFPAGASGVGFIAKLNPAGGGSTDLLYSTFFGGIGMPMFPDQIFGIAIDGASPPNAYVTGEVFSTAATFPVFPTTAFQTTLNGTSDAFVAKLTPIPTLGVSPTSLNFGTVLIPNTSAAQSVTLMNNTNAAIAFTSATLTGANMADFKISANTCGASIPAGMSCTVSVTFTPSIAGAEAATLVLTDGDSTSPQNIALSGTGTNVPPDFTITGPGMQTVMDGSQVQFNVTVTAVGGFSSSVSLACASAPMLILGTCTPSPASVTPTAAGVQSTVTVTTTALLPPPGGMRNPPLSPRQILPLVLALVMLFSLWWVRRLRVALAAAMILLIAIAGCSGPPKPHTLKGNYTLTITGTSGALSHNTTVTLTVN